MMRNPVFLLSSFILFCVLRRGSLSLTPAVSVQLTEINLCLEKALKIQNELGQGRCPYDMLNAGINCTINCSGKFSINNSLYDEEKTCVNFTLDLSTSTNLHENVPPTLQKRHCNIPECIFEWIEITCTFPKEIDTIGSTSINVNSERQENKQKNLLLALGCGVAGCIIGILLTVTWRCFKEKALTNFRRASFVPVNQDQTVQRTGESMDNLYMYCDIENIARYLSEKGTQVPSLKDKSPSSTRSRTSNVYHLLSEKGSPVDSISSIVRTTSSQSSTSDNFIHDKSLRKSNSSTETNVMVQIFEKGDDIKYFKLENKPKDAHDI